MTPSDIFTAYFDLGQHLAAAVMPYALHLLYLLIFVEVLTIGITWMIGENDYPAELLWRIGRLVFTGGFAYWWLVNCWALGVTVLGSFNQLGQQITGTPGLTPVALINAGTGITKLLWNAPSTARLIPDIGLKIGEFMLIILILLIFLVIAALAIFTITSMWLILGPGSIVIAFLPCRFTSALTEGYFTWLIRSGVVVLGFYVVLATAQTFALRWDTTLASACGATLTMLPAPHLGGPPTLVSATTCTAPVPTASLLTLLADVVVLAFIAIGVPFTAGAIVSHGVNMAIEHFAAAKYLAGSVSRPIVGAMAGLSRQVYRHMRSTNNQYRLEQRLAAGAAAAAATRPSQAVTTRLPRPPAVNAFGVPYTTGFNGSSSRKTSKL